MVLSFNKGKIQNIFFPASGLVSDLKRLLQKIGRLKIFAAPIHMIIDTDIFLIFLSFYNKLSESLSGLTLY